MTTQSGPRFEDRKRFNAFKQFHRDNPEIFDRFVFYAKTARRKNRQRFSARMIGERIRWYSVVETASNDPWKICNNHWPYYARLMMLHYPEYQNFFRRRDATFDVDDATILREIPKGVR